MGQDHSLKTKMGNCELQRRDITSRMWWSLSVWQNEGMGSPSAVLLTSGGSRVQAVWLQVGQRLWESYLNFCTIIVIHFWVCLPWISQWECWLPCVGLSVGVLCCVKQSYSDPQQCTSEQLLKVTIAISSFSQKLAAKETEPLQRQGK